MQTNLPLHLTNFMYWKPDPGVGKLMAFAAENTGYMGLEEVITGGVSVMGLMPWCVEGKSKNHCF